VAKTQLDLVHPSKSTADWADQKVHNYIGAGIESAEKVVPLDFGFKYDYSYDYYNSYDGPTMVPGTAESDWKVSIPLTKGFGTKVKVVDDLVAAQLKANGVAQDSDGKTFYGLDVGGSLKLFLGLEVNLQIGIKR
jgi:hypothetical protein